MIVPTSIHSTPQLYWTAQNVNFDKKNLSLNAFLVEIFNSMSLSSLDQFRLHHFHLRPLYWDESQNACLTSKEVHSSVCSYNPVYLFRFESEITLKRVSIFQTQCGKSIFTQCTTILWMCAQFTITRQFILSSRILSNTKQINENQYKQA